MLGRATSIDSTWPGPADPEHRLRLAGAPVRLDRAVGLEGREPADDDGDDEEEEQAQPLLRRS